MSVTVVFLLGMIVGACAAWALTILYSLLILGGRMPDADVEDTWRS